MKKIINILTALVIISAFFMINSRCNKKIEAPGTLIKKVDKKEKKMNRPFEDFPL